MVIKKLKNNCQNSKMKAIWQLKKGELFRLKSINNAPVWLRGEYSRSERCYSCYKVEDETYVKLIPRKVEVYTNFEI